MPLSRVKQIRIEFQFFEIMVCLIVLISIFISFTYLWGVLFRISFLLAIGLAGYLIVKVRRRSSNDSKLSFGWALIWSLMVFYLIYTANAMLPIHPLPYDLLIDPPPRLVYSNLVFFGVLPSIILLAVMMADIFRFERLVYRLKQQQELS